MKQRPLSPHLQVYRPQITSVLSIMHRITGAGLSAGLLLLGWGIWSLSRGEEAYQCFIDYVTHPLGKIVVLGFIWALCYHLLNGIRHLFWDAGLGFKMATVNASGWVTVIFSFVLTAVFACLCFY
ncbi:MAG: succinate dehydrogenase, cytochrome b556 subunit [Micavibrio sp.]|nr:MAG: succinate dehydrogenase, cytochrome b556 subunit [Micavibrio sp.]